MRGGGRLPSQSLFAVARFRCKEAAQRTMRRSPLQRREVPRRGQRHLGGIKAVWLYISGGNIEHGALGALKESSLAGGRTVGF